ncbi:MAG TPA: succinate dehydrogenase [Eoetvoesiella sp.]
MSSTAAGSARRWYWQRISAMAMAAFVLVHLAVMVYAIRGGLSAAEILERTRGSIAWAAFYALFVVLVAIHSSIGIRNVLVEWTAIKDSFAAVLSNALALLLLFMGLRAVWAVTTGGAP